MSETLSPMEFFIGSNATGSSGGLSRATKKVRRRVDYPPESKDPTVDMNGQSIPKSLTRGVSYKETFMGLGTTHDRDDFHLQDGDFMMELVDGVPLVKFSSRVHCFIEKKMENSLVIKLIGKNIGFNALLNRIQLLWKPVN